MVEHIITIYHPSKDPHNPYEQRIHEAGDYGIRYALFMALLDSGKDFKIEIAKEGERA